MTFLRLPRDVYDQLAQSPGLHLKAGRKLTLSKKHFQSICKRAYGTENILDVGDLSSPTSEKIFIVKSKRNETRAGMKNRRNEEKNQKII